MVKKRLGAKYLIDDLVYDEHVVEMVSKEVSRGVSEEIKNIVTSAENPIIFYPLKETIQDEYETNRVAVSAFCNVAEVCLCKDCIYSDRNLICKTSGTRKAPDGFCDEGIPRAHIDPEESEASFTISDAREMLKRE